MSPYTVDTNLVISTATIILDTLVNVLTGGALTHHVQCLVELVASIAGADDTTKIC